MIASYMAAFNCGTRDVRKLVNLEQNSASVKTVFCGFSRFRKNIQNTRFRPAARRGQKYKQKSHLLRHGHQCFNLRKKRTYSLQRFQINQNFARVSRW